MRTLKWWLFGFWLFAGRLSALRQRGRHRQRQGTPGQRDRRHRTRTIDLGGARARHSRRLAYLLAQSRRFRPGDQARLDVARRVTAGDIVWTTPHRFEIPPLVNYGYAKHAMHLVKITAPKDSRPPRARARGQSELAGVLRCLHPRKRRPELKLPVKAAAGPSILRRGSVHRGARRIADRAPAASGARIGRPTAPHARQGLGRHPVADQSLAFYPYDDGASSTPRRKR